MVEHTPTRGQMVKAVRKLLDSGEWPEYKTQDDNGLEASEYVDFVTQVLALISSTAASGTQDAIHGVPLVWQENADVKRFLNGLRKIKEYLEAKEPRVGDAAFICEALLADDVGGPARG